MSAGPELVVVADSVYRKPGSAPAQAVGVTGDRIVAVGSERDLLTSRSPRARVVRLPGAFIVPGFQDAHVHPARGAIGDLYCDLSDLDGEAAYLERIAGYAAEHPGDEWVRGRGWKPGAFPAGAPRREVLDAVLGMRPGFFVSDDGHSAWASTEALRRAGIDRSTPDPADGEIVRDAGGEPGGTLRETANGLIERLLPAPSAREWEAAILRAQSMLHSLGITAWQDAHLEPRDVHAYRALKERGALTGKVVGAHWWDRERGAEQLHEFDELRRLPPLAGLDFGSVKVMVDGIIESATATLVEPYRGVFAHKGRGSGFFDGPALRGIAAAVDAAGYQLHFHAVGDRAVRDALDACEHALRVNGPRDSRHHISHIELVHPGDLARFARLGVAANMQPLWATDDTQMSSLRIPVLGEARARWQFPFRSLAEAGARLAGGSDWAVSTADPLAQIAVAVTRRAPRPPRLAALGPEERLEVRQAIDAFTSGSAWVNFLDGSTGSIAPGRTADLAVVDRNLLAVAPDDLGFARNLLTVADGRIVFAADGV